MIPLPKGLVAPLASCLPLGFPSFGAKDISNLQQLGLCYAAVEANRAILVACCSLLKAAPDNRIMQRLLHRWFLGFLLRICMCTWTTVQD